MGSFVGSDGLGKLLDVLNALLDVEVEDVVLSFDFSLEFKERVDGLLFAVLDLVSVSLEFSNQFINESEGLSNVIFKIFISVVVVVETEGTLVVVDVTGSDFRFSSGGGIEFGVQFVFSQTLIFFTVLNGGLEHGHKVELSQSSESIFVLVGDGFLQHDEGFRLSSNKVLESFLGHLFSQELEEFDSISDISDLLKEDKIVVASLFFSLLDGGKVVFNLFLGRFNVLFEGFLFGGLSVNLDLDGFTLSDLSVQSSLIISDLLEEDGFVLLPLGIELVEVFNFGGLKILQQLKDLTNSVTSFLEEGDDLRSESLCHTSSGSVGDGKDGQETDDE
mmetsp:Transcript_38949/g.34621  ORF Transcript_38949/g.34621 Transcript_38949/m.34621 type:complete len:333 (+) Transcript_38949:674-1672(+)